MSDFLPGSSSKLFVVRARSVLFFNIESASSTVASSYAVEVGPDTSFRGVIAVELNRDAAADGPLESWKVFALMEDGRLHTFGLVADDLDDFRAMNLTFEAKQSTKLPIGGFSDKDKHVPSFSLTMGEGVHLSYLRQSNVLLYQAASERVLALKIDSSGAISSSFTMLPKITTKDLLGSSDSRFVTGPYTHWTELGAVRYGPLVYFRACCIGRRSGKEAAILCVEFNETETRVKELTYDSCGHAMGSSLAPAGLVAFSAPFLRSKSSGISFDERIFVAVMLSNGSLHVYGETFGANAVASGEQSVKSHSWTPPESLRESLERPLLVFEQLLNLTNTDSITYHGVGIGNASDISGKLCRESADSISSTGVDGFTVSVRIKPKPNFDSTDAIVALRILVGATSLNSIPRRLLIAGRELELERDTQKWYCFHLTLQEIASSVRNDFVTIVVSSTHSSLSSPIIDAIECFGFPRREMESWVANALTSVVSDGAEFPEQTSNKIDSQEDIAVPELLRLCLQCFAMLCSLQNTQLALLPPDRDILEGLIELTAIEPDHDIKESIDSILLTFEGDAEVRESFHDNAVLKGCTAYLSKCQHVLSGDQSDLNTFEARWQCICSPLAACFEAAILVAKCRPLNYFQYVGDNSLSPAAIARSFIPHCFMVTSSNLNIVGLFVELCLMEMAVATRSGAGPKAEIGRFDGLRNMLICKNMSVVSLTCSTITGFCRKYEAPSPLEGVDCDLFAVQKMVAYYRCDSCGLFPIKDIRFSLSDDARPFDLCQSCHRLAHAFAERVQFNRKRDVLVHGETVGQDMKLSCAEVKDMRPVKIRSEGSKHEGDGNESKDVPCDATGMEFVQRQQLFDDFMDRLFSEVVGFLVEELKDRGLEVESWIHLATSIVHHSGNGDRKTERAKRLGKVLVRVLSSCLALVGSESGFCGNRARALSNTKVLLRNLAKLVVADEGALVILDNSVSGTEDHDSSIGPTCPGHGIAAIRRKHTSGANEGKKFYTCPSDSYSRCNFFLWENEFDPDDEQQPLSHFNDEVAKCLWGYISEPPGIDSEASEVGFGRFRTTSSVSLLLCDFIATQASSLLKRHGSTNRDDLHSLDGIGVRDPFRELSDGVFCSRARLQNGTAVTKALASPLSIRSRASLLRSPSASQGAEMLVVETVEATFSLLALVAGPGAVSTSRWAPLLCEILLSAQDTVILRLCKRALFQLCGQQKGLYASTRANYSFSFHRRKLVEILTNLVKEALIVKEKARQSGHHWRASEPLKLRNLRAGDCLGTEE